jgi:hypothetical protein
LNRFYAGLVGFAKTCIGSIPRVLHSPPPLAVAGASPSPSCPSARLTRSAWPAPSSPSRRRTCPPVWSVVLSASSPSSPPDPRRGSIWVGRNSWAACRAGSSAEWRGGGMGKKGGRGRKGRELGEVAGVVPSLADRAGPRPFSLSPAFPERTRDPGYGLGRPDQNTPKSGRKEVPRYATGPIFSVRTEIRRPDRRRG